MEAGDTLTITRVARDVVEESAPAELPLFDETAESFFAAGGARRRQAAPDDMLGFGAEIAPFLTPLILSVATYAVGLVKDAVQRRLSDGVDGVAGRVEDAALALLHPDQKTRATLAQLPADELKRIRAAVYENAVTVGLEAQAADVLATSVVGKLATA